MACPICDQKPTNCDCTDAERRQYAEIQELEERMPRWIPVEERLPEEEEEVLACWVPRNDGMACAVIRNLNGKVCWTPADQWTECDPPKWWMPLPEPPKNK